MTVASVLHCLATFLPLLLLGHLFSCLCIYCLFYQRRCRVLTQYSFRGTEQKENHQKQCEPFLAIELAEKYAVATHTNVLQNSTPHNTCVLLGFYEFYDAFFFFPFYKTTVSCKCCSLYYFLLPCRDITQIHIKQEWICPEKVFTSHVKITCRYFMRWLFNAVVKVSICFIKLYIVYIVKKSKIYCCL